MSLKVQVARGLKWQAISIVGKQLLSVVVFTTLARVLQPSAFGLAALINVYLGVVNMLVDQGIGTALIQRQYLKHEHKDAAFWFNMTCSVVLCVGTIAMAGPVSELFKEPRLIPLLRWSSLGLVIGASASIHATLFARDLDFRRPVIRNLVANLGGGIVGVVMALAGCGVWSLVGQQLSSEIAGAVFLWKTSPYRPSMRFSFSHLRELFGVSASVFATSILWYFSCRLDQLVIGRFSGMLTLGLYSVALKIPSMASMVTQQPLASVSLPSLSRLQDDHKKMREAVRHGMELNAVISFAIFVGLAAVASDLVPILFGAKWATAGPLCALLALFSLVDALLVFCHPILLASGGIGKFVWLNVWHVVGVLAACLVGIRFGITFLVLGLILNSLITAIPALLFLQQRISLSPLGYCRPCLAPCLASLFMVCVIYVVTIALPSDIPLLIRLLCKILIGAMTYTGCILLLDRSILRKLIDTFSHAFRRPSVPAETVTAL